MFDGWFLTLRLSFIFSIKNRFNTILKVFFAKFYNKNQLKINAFGGKESAVKKKMKTATTAVRGHFGEIVCALSIYVTHCSTNVHRQISYTICWRYADTKYTERIVYFWRCYFSVIIHKTHHLTHDICKPSCKILLFLVFPRLTSTRNVYFCSFLITTSLYTRRRVPSVLRHQIPLKCGDDRWSLLV